jgi:hypothetical protein
VAVSADIFTHAPRRLQGLQNSLCVSYRVCVNTNVRNAFLLLRACVHCVFYRLYLPTTNWLTYSLTESLTDIWYFLGSPTVWAQVCWRRFGTLCQIKVDPWRWNRRVSKRRWLAAEVTHRGLTKKPRNIIRITMKAWRNGWLTHCVTDWLTWLTNQPSNWTTKYLTN